MSITENVSAEELAQEQQQIVLPKEEEIRAEIITEYGFDETVDGDKIEKLTKKELEHRKRTSDAIRQKIKHRTEKDELRKKIPPETTPPPTTENKSELSQTDLLAVMSERVHVDDLDYVKRYAKLENITVTEALKKDDLKEILKVKAEQRATANATNTGSGRHGTAKVTDEALLEKASKGEVSEEDIDKLTEARMNLRKKR